MGTENPPGEYPDATRKPCHDCPWRRNATPGWLGPMTAEDWVRAAHGEGVVWCHETFHEDDPDPATPGLKQCGGMAQFRANIFKSPRDERIVTADQRDTTNVFGWNDEFYAHHVGSAYMVSRTRVVHKRGCFNLGEKAEPWLTRHAKDRACEHCLHGALPQEG